MDRKLSVAGGFPVSKSQIPSTKLQINLKFQYPMTKKFEILNFGHCDFFDIWNLKFVIYQLFIDISRLKILHVHRPSFEYRLMIITFA